MNNRSMLLSDLDDLQYRLECGAKIVEAVHECMAVSANSAEEYNDALFGAYLYIKSLSKELAQIVDKQYKDGVK